MLVKLEPERLKVTALNLFHPAASPPFQKVHFFHIATHPPWGEGKGEGDMCSLNEITQQRGSVNLNSPNPASSPNPNAPSSVSPS